MPNKDYINLDYYAFGMEMPGRKWQASNYRYSHNGHEKEEEIFSGAQSAEFWMYDSRIGRRWNIDPVVDESLSPYACFNNNPIYFNDINGDSPTDPKGGGDKGGGNKGGGKKTVKHGSSKSPDGKTTKLPDTDVGGTKSPKSAPTGGSTPVTNKTGKSNSTKTNLLDDIVWLIDYIALDIQKIPEVHIFLMADKYAEKQLDKDDLTPPVHTKLSGLENRNPGPTKGRAISGTGNIETVQGYDSGSMLLGMGKSSPLGGFKPFGAGKWVYSPPSNTRGAIETFANINSQNQNGASIVDNYNSLKPKPASRFSTVRWGPDDSVRTYPNSSDDPNNDTLYQFFKKGSSDVLPYKMYDGNKLMPTSIYHK